MFFCFRRKIAVLSDEGKRNKGRKDKKKANENYSFNDNKIFEEKFKQLLRI